MYSLEEWRRRKAISIFDLAAKAGVSNKTISDIENGKVRAPSFRTINKVSTALEIAPDQVAEFMAPRRKGNG